MTTPVQAVVVHHRSRDTITTTVDSLIGAGVSARHIIVVDNSPPEDPDLDLSTRRITVLRTRNDGYAAAANTGLIALEANEPQPFTLVCSHEARTTPRSLAALVRALESDQSIAVAGPTLLIGQSSEVWSTGGYLSRWLRLPRHSHDERQGHDALVDRDWLDGALTVYRTSTLLTHPFDERYFLYFEETDLHTRLRAAGYRVVWVPSSEGNQTSSGIPPRLLGRNLLLFHSTHFSVRTGRVAVAYEMVRAIGRKALTGRGSWDAGGQILSGWRDAEHALAQRRRGEVTE
jgi:N-acetylglucosaminyl-diphospho-decaprenol L-rhamnosyltransferase